MSTFTIEEIAERAEAVAKEMSARVVPAYIASVKRYPEGYKDNLPDAEDFFAWLEGYDWSAPE